MADEVDVDPNADRQRVPEKYVDHVVYGRVAVGLPGRLHASRLRAKYTSAELAAKHMGVQGRNYRSVENGTRKPTPRVVELASMCFRVSREYLLLADPVLPEDREAAAIEAVMEDLRSQSWADDKTIGNRLKEARRKAGFETADDALRASGLKPSAYKGHEAGFTPIPLDRMILYAGMFGVDARALGLAQVGTVEPARSDGASPSEAGRSVANVRRPPQGILSEPAPWPWLVRTSASSDVLSLQVLKAADNGLLVPATFQLTVPVDGSSMAGEGDTIYAVLATERGNATDANFLIVRPYRGEAAASDLVISDGLRISTDVRLTDNLRDGDPLTVRGEKGRPVILGRKIGEFTLRWGASQDLSREP